MSSGAILRTIASAVGILMMAVSVLVWYAAKVSTGARVEIMSQQAVHYSGDATDQDARRLGEALKEVGYFDGLNEKDVLLRKSNEETTVSFVVIDGAWNDKETIDAFEVIGSQVAESIGGVPVTVRLIDANLRQHKEFVCRELRTITGRARKITEQETVYFSGQATEEDAAKLGAVLQEIGYFAGAHPLDVLLRKTEQGITVSFVVYDGAWNEAEHVENFREVGRQVAPSFDGSPLMVQLADDRLFPRKALRIE